MLRRLLYETLPHPRRLRVLQPLIGLGRRARVRALTPAPLRTLTDVAPRSVAGTGSTAIPKLTPAAGEPRGRVGLLLGCVQRVFYPQVHRATVDVLAAEGFEVVAPVLPDCCGALELHGGAEDGARRRARETIDVFAALDVDHVVVNAAGCGSAMKEYGELLGDPGAQAFAAKVRDISELLGSVTPRAARGPLALRVVYHDACHLAHAQRIRSAPRSLLRGIPQLELLEVAEEPAVCCGSAGIYNLVEPEAAAQLGERKARNLLATGADVIAAGNPGCAAQLDLHLRGLGASLPIRHPIELLAESLAGGR
jgi:glycolate oxidase iron-sulfur subunit